MLKSNYVANTGNLNSYLQIVVHLVLQR